MIAIRNGMMMNGQQSPVTKVKRLVSLLLTAVVAVAFAFMWPVHAQQGFQDPFGKTGFHAGDLYSTIGASSVDAHSGRLVYAIPVLNLPRNGALPESLNLVYNSTDGDVAVKAQSLGSGWGSPAPWYSVYIRNRSSNLGMGWRLSPATLTVGESVSGNIVNGEGRDGLIFYDSEGGKHALHHTDGCPPTGCLSVPPMVPGYNEMQPGVYRSADGQFYQAEVEWSPGLPKTNNTVERVTVRSPSGLVYIFRDFTDADYSVPMLDGYNIRSPRAAEVSEIRDPDGNVLTFTYDHGISLKEWNLRSIYDGIRTIHFEQVYDEFENMDINELKQAQLVSPCFSGANTAVDRRSCRYATENEVPEHCDDEHIGEPPPVSLPKFSGRLLKQLIVKLENGDQLLRVNLSTRELCMTVMEDHYASRISLPPYATIVDSVQFVSNPLSPSSTLDPVYRFTYLPDGALWKVVNPLGAEEEFSWRGYRVARWDSIGESCKLKEFPADPPGFTESVTGGCIDRLTCTGGFCKIVFTNTMTGAACSTDSPMGDVWAKYVGEDRSTCVAGKVMNMRCEQYRVEIPAGYSPPNGWRNPTECGPSPAYNGQFPRGAIDDPACMCERFTVGRADVNMLCQPIGDVGVGHANGIQRRTLTDTGRRYIWRYDRHYSDVLENPAPGQDWRTRKFVEITNPDWTQERLYFYENTEQACSLGHSANKLGMPSAREVMDRYGNVIMREEYNYSGYPMPGSVVHERLKTTYGSIATKYLNLSRALADFYRVGTTTKYYRPHLKPSLLAGDSAAFSDAVRVGSNDDIVPLRWNLTLAGEPDSMQTDVNLPAAVAEPLTNGEFDHAYLLYAHRTTQEGYLELGHFTLQRHCPAVDAIDWYNHPDPSRLDSWIKQSVCVDRGFDPIDPARAQHTTRTVFTLPAMGNDWQQTETWWRTERNPALDPERARWTVNQPVQQFLLAPKGSGLVPPGFVVNGSSLSRYENGKLKQARSVSLSGGNCGTNDAAFPSRNADGTLNSKPVPGDLLLDPACGESVRDRSSDVLSRLDYHSDGNLSKQSIASGRDAAFPDNSAGEFLGSPVALNFTWENGAASTSKFEGHSYENQHRRISSERGYVESVKDANGKETRYEYDHLLRVTRIIPPDGELASTIDYPTLNTAILRKGDTELRYAYDGLGRVWRESKKMPAITPETDAAGFVHRYTGYDFAGRQSFHSEWTGDGDYDPRRRHFECGRIGSVTENPTPEYVRGGSNIVDPSNLPVSTIAATSLPFPGTWTCYDALGRPSRIVAADGATTEYHYLGVDSVVRVFHNKATSGQPDPDAQMDQVTKYYHDAFGRLIMVDTDCRLDFGQPAAVADLKCGTTAGIGADAVYFYDVAGRLTMVNLIAQLPANPREAYIAIERDPRAGLAGSPFGLGQLRTFDYDSLGRLKRACNPENGCVDYLDYDALGNVLEVQDERGGGAKPVTAGTNENVIDGCDSDLFPTLSPITLDTPAEPCANPDGMNACVSPATGSLSFTWNGIAPRKACAAPSLTARLTGPGGFEHVTHSCAPNTTATGALTSCTSDSFSILTGTATSPGVYDLQVTLTNYSGSVIQTFRVGVNNPPATIAILKPTDEELSQAGLRVRYASLYPPAGAFVNAFMAVGKGAQSQVRAGLPASGEFTIEGVHNTDYAIRLELRDVNGVFLSNADLVYTVNRKGNYTLRYQYDAAGRLTTVKKFSLADGASETLTELFYDGYTGNLATYHPDPGSGPIYANAPLGKKTGAISYQNGWAIVQATDYQERGGRPNSSWLTVNDGVNPSEYNSAISYNDLGLPLTMTYPGFVGDALQTTSGYSAGYLQFLSGDTRTGSTQRNYLTGLSFNPAGTLQGFNLGSSGLRTEMTYDIRNRPSHIVHKIPGLIDDPFDSGEYQYDGAGNITAIGTDTFGYDVLNRLKTATVARRGLAGVPVGTQSFAYAYDLFGNMTGKSSPAGTLAPVGNLANPFIKSLTFGQATPRDYTLGADAYAAALGPAVGASGTRLPEFSVTNRINEPGYVYDANGNLIEDPQFCYDYDVLNRMASVRAKLSGACQAGFRAKYFYDADNLRAVRQLWNSDGTVASSVTSFRGGLDAASDFTRHVNDGNPNPFEQKNYIYGPGGLIASENRTLHFELCTGTRCGGGGGVNSVSFAAVPLATVTSTPADGYSLELNYGECPAPGLQYLSLEWHELRSDGTPKDCTNHDLEDPAGTDARHNCGRVVIEPGDTATLVKLKYGKTYSFKTMAFFDLGLAGPSQTLISQFTGSLAANHPATDYALNELQPNTLAAACVNGIVAPNRPRANTFAVTSDREVNYYQKDHLGTTRIVTNEAGVVLSTHDYEPFGLELPWESASANTHRFTGHERDTETGLDYMKARYYGAGMGRFGAVDPSIDSVIFSFSYSWNRYTYTDNNPAAYLDIDGLKKLLGIHSNVTADASWRSGHSWISVYDTDTNKTDTYGLWPDRHDFVINRHQSDSGSDIRHNYEIEENSTHRYDPVISRYYELSEHEEAELNGLLQSNISWDVTNTCADWAVSVWKSITKESLNVNDFNNIGTPRIVTDSLVKAESLVDTRPKRPLNDPRNKESKVKQPASQPQQNANDDPGSSSSPF